MYINEYPDVFYLPDRQSAIWRYISYEKFRSLLSEKALFFSRSDQFGDHFEGSYPKESAIKTALQLLKSEPKAYFDDDGRIKRAEDWISVRRQFRESILVNCWHMNEHESEAMWKLYAGCNNNEKENKGIVIKSSIQRLIESLKHCSEKVHIGAIQYRDYDRDAFQSSNIFEPFVSKRKSFEHERELRAVIYDEERFKGLSGTWPTTRQDAGTPIPVDLDDLIEEIRIAPGAPDAFRESVVTLCSHFFVLKEVRQSKMDDPSLF